MIVIAIIKSYKNERYIVRSLWWKKRHKKCHYKRIFLKVDKFIVVHKYNYLSRLETVETNDNIYDKAQDIIEDLETDHSKICDYKLMKMNVKYIIS